MKALLRLGALLLCLLALPALAQQDAAIPALDSPVIDTTGTLDAGLASQLRQQALDLQQRKGAQLQILMVPSTQPEAIEQYTQRVFDQWKLGRKGVDDAVLIVVAKDDRRVRIQPGYGLEGAIPDAVANRVIQEYMAPHFRQNDYGGGLVDATAVLVKLVDGEALPAPQSTHQTERRQGGDGWIFGLVFGLVAASFVRTVLRWLPKPVRAVAGGLVGGGVAWLLSSLLLVGGLAGIVGLLMGLFGGAGGRFAGPGGFGGFGGGWGGGGFGGGGGGFGGGAGGWGGGGGSSGGGGASGSW
ncbi:TPM domain-containing protein [Pseudoxanthomonas sp.]|uniref:TPM domain-containing protein n=1 Tax=Pseudoxanthomonas sp. TaxID=1871049 RepID=UPI0026327BC0|nr:TPM domain-containing protein [Pseudoxanthomonas sp.]WDS37492.1 MAG: TPM domain-containing protein [Pseudoxanthomonas sp.]